jgi:hypothetical protein
MEDLSMQNKLYADRGMDVLREPEYIAHVQAMTAEGLHSKADIAAELAYRDILIREARAIMLAVVCLDGGMDDRHDQWLADTEQYHVDVPGLSNDGVGAHG